MWKIMRNYLTSIHYWMPRLTLILLCELHEKTKFHTARSIRELFYWPEGICLDMFVIASFCVVAVVCLWRDYKMLSQIFTYDLEED